ncbi:MAG: hypothetical protein Q4E88_06760 [Coriobacteriia bacterium]|nr:hypothetical protein [Coriobacteriia bacterium]
MKKREEHITYEVVPIQKWVDTNKRFYDLIVEECLNRCSKGSTYLYIVDIMAMIIWQKHLNATIDVADSLSSYIETQVPQLKGKFIHKQTQEIKMTFSQFLALVNQ